MSRPVSETVSPETLARLKRREYEPRHKPAGPAYPAARVFGFNVNPSDTTKAKIPSIKFKGTDAQFQEILDKANRVMARKQLSRPEKIEVTMYKLEVKLRQMQTLKIKELERRVRILETIAQYDKEDIPDGNNA